MGNIIRYNQAEYDKLVLGTEPDSLIRYIPQRERKGTVARDLSKKREDGAYSGVTLGGGRAPNGDRVPFFPGTGGSIDIKNNLDGDMNKVTGTFMIHFKVSDVSVWTDGQGRRLFHFDNDSAIFLWKLSVDNIIEFKIFNKGVLINPISTTDWVVLFCTYDDGVNVIELFKDGISQGTNTMADLTSVTYTNIAIGSDADLSGNHWDGYLRQFAMWTKVLSLKQIQRLSLKAA